MTPEEIKDLRSRTGVSQEFFAAMIGAKRRSTICNWEKGTRTPDRYFSEKLEKLNKVFAK